MSEMNYVYGMKYRGFSIGCQPKKGFVQCMDDPQRKYHDLIVYDRKLTENEVNDYELDFITEVDQLREDEPKTEEKYQEVEVFGKSALFSNERVYRCSLPDGLFAYDLRGSDFDPGKPISLENFVIVNHAGMIITAEKIDMPDSGRLMLGDNGLNFTGGEKSISEFLMERASMKQHSQDS